jgi:hypothetical protein
VIIIFYFIVIKNVIVIQNFIVIKNNITIYIMDCFPDDINLIIYSYVGNKFIVNKNINNKIIEIRKKFYKTPIKLYYRLARWKYNKKWGGEGNRTIYNKFKTKMRPTLKVTKTMEVNIYDIPIGKMNCNGNIYPSKMLEDKLIPKSFPKYDLDNVYINTNGYSWSVYMIFSKNIEKCRKYIDIRPYNGKVNTKIISYNLSPT